MRSNRERNSFLLGALSHDAVIVRSAGYFGLQFAFPGLVVKPIQNGFILFCRQLVLRRNLHSTTHWDKHKDMEGISAQVQGKFIDAISFGDIVSSQSVIDLHTHSSTSQVQEACQGSGKGPGNTTKFIVDRSAGAINADRNSFKAS